MHTLSTFIQYNIEVLATAIRRKKKVNSIHIEMEEVKLLLFAGNVIVYIENPETSPKKFPVGNNK